MKYFKTLIIIILCLVFLTGCYDRVPAEKLAITTGFGYDVDKIDKTKLICSMEFLKGEESEYLVGKGNGIYQAIEDYKTKQPKPFAYGSEQVYLISEERAKLGIEDIIYDLIGYPGINLNARVLICKNHCEDYFSMKNAAGSNSEKLADLIEFAKEKYFFSCDYTIFDLICMYYQNSREIYLPYVELIEEKPQLTGSIIFKDNSYFKKVDIDEAKLINVIRNSGGRGVLTINSYSPTLYLELEGKSKTKVKTSSKDGKIKYTIDVVVAGDLRLNTLKKVELSKEELKKLSKMLEEQFKKELENEIKKIQNEYKVDCLNLSRHAQAKFGREKDYKNNNYFPNAIIEINVVVKISSTGRIWQFKPEM